MGDNYLLNRRCHANDESLCVYLLPPPLTLSSSLSIRRYALKADNTLIIKKLTLEDEGMFQCLASNEVGEKSAYTWMRVKSKSSYHYHYHPISISLSWCLHSLSRSWRDVAFNLSDKN